LTAARPISAHGRKGLVGVLVPLVYDLYFSAILSGVAEGAYEHGLQLLLSPTLHEHAREASVLDRLRSVTDGALIVLPEESSAELELAVSDAYPFVVIDPLMPLDRRVPAVAAEHEAGARDAMRHLLGLGHRRIAAITGPPGWLATEARLRSYLAALTDAGIAPDPVLQVTSDFEFAPGMAAAATLLALPDPPTAIFAFNDAIALGAMRAARDRGIRVPEDLSVVGFDDIKYAAMVTPALTTVRQPLADMGHTAVSLLIRLLEHEPLDTLHLAVATRLAVRESTAPPRPSG
jgi:LacI family transcriptional regulator, galactose operon repressor